MTMRGDVELLDSAILMRPEVWQASGHAATFSYPMVDCTNCQKRFRADKLEDGICGKTAGQASGSQKSCVLTPPRDFNLMFQTQVGPMADSLTNTWLRPETVQGIFVNFLNVQATMSQRLPSGIAQVGKAFRNELTPGNFLFRLREFEQMEMQLFVPPSTSMQWLEEWEQAHLDWHTSLGLKHLSVVPHAPDKLAHYARKAVDITFDFADTLGAQGIEGIHHRGSFDLSNNQYSSRKRLEYFDPEHNTHYIPEVIETSVGLDRFTLAMLSNSYQVDHRRSAPATCWRFLHSSRPSRCPYSL